MLIPGLSVSCVILEIHWISLCFFSFLVIQRDWTQSFLLRDLGSHQCYSQIFSSLFHSKHMVEVESSNTLKLNVEMWLASAMGHERCCFHTEVLKTSPWFTPSPSQCCYGPNRISLDEVSGTVDPSVTKMISNFPANLHFPCGMSKKWVSVVWSHWDLNGVFGYCWVT